MTRKNKKPKTKRSRRKRIFRSFLWTIFIISILIVLLITGLVLYLTPSRIESIAEKFVSENLGRQLSFTNAHFNIFNGFIFEDIILSPPDSNDNPVTIPVHSATANEISLRYSLAGILKKRFLITSALIDSPNVKLVITPFEKDSLQKKEPAPSDTVLAVDSFIALNLNRFRLKNANITVDVLDSLQRRRIYLSDMSLSIDDVAIPRGDVLAQDSLLCGRFAMDCQNATCLFEQQLPEQRLEFAGLLDAHVDMTLASLASIDLSGSLAMQDVSVDIDETLSLDPSDLSFPFIAEFHGFINAHAGSARLEPTIKIDDVPWLSLDIQADSLLSIPVVEASVTKSQIPVHQLIDLARPFVVDSLIPAIYLHNPNAFISLAGTTVSGSIPDSTNDNYLSCNANIALENFGATLNRDEQFLRNFNFVCRASAMLGYNIISESVANISVSYDSVFITTTDEQKVFSGQSFIEASVALDAKLFPTMVDAELSMSNVLGADIDGDIALHSTGGLSKLAGDGMFSVQSIDIAPLTQSQLQTKVSAYAELNLNTLNDISATFNIGTNVITLKQDMNVLTFSPLDLTSTIQCATDTLFQQLTLSSMTASVNDFITSELAGNAVLAPQPIVDLNNLFVSLDHAALLSWLPMQLKEPIADVVVTGKTTLNSQAHLSLSDTTLQAGLDLLTHDFTLDYQDGLAFLSGIVLDIKGDLNSKDSASVMLALSIDNIKSSEFAKSVFRDNKILLNLTMPDFETVRIDTGLLDLPDLKTKGTIAGNMRLVNDSPFVDSNIRLTQNAADTIRLMQDIFYLGKNEITIDVQSDSAVARVAAAVNTTDLTVSLPNDIRVDRINSHIVLSQDIDIQEGAILMSPQGTVFTPSDGLVDYRLYRDYYFQKNKRPSEINIRRAIVGDYRVENIHAEAYIGAGTVEIPAFTLDAYGGNVGGSFSFTSHERNIAESSFKMSAHISGINSALLLPSLQAKSQGLLTAHAELEGEGLDIIHGIDLDGYFNITKIESKVASNLLTSLDPEGKDSAIKFTKLVMNYGYKPRLLTFDIGHGYCYPAVYFSQPWYNPIRLSGGSIEFARIPLASLLTAQK